MDQPGLAAVPTSCQPDERREQCQGAEFTLPTITRCKSEGLAPGKHPHMCAAGTIALSGKLADSLDALYNGRIPKDWLAKSWEAGSLGSWFAGLLQRHEQLLRWLSTGRPKAYWLTGFFNPQAGPLCHASSSSSIIHSNYSLLGWLQAIAHQLLWLCGQRSSAIAPVQGVHRARLSPL